ncbi:MAG: RNA 2',3'-cyclic phosphodiesterase [Heliobacteriaceae bacterium]|nr:RNA 2',3'-cyclic phosphodiesterase [Heliobacteriaceae bacterium]MDD4587885.1 RNA 2',3'-cyclic phosphodiesterase [Heliobacteriaceae bacterium]
MRAFFAVGVSRQVAGLADDLQLKLKQAGVKAKWVDPTQLHVTVKFLGEVTPDLAVELAVLAGNKLAGRHAFSLGFGPVGAFPHWRVPRVVWLGVRDEARQLASLFMAVQEAAEALGLPREVKPYQPHLTLGRVKAWPVQGVPLPIVPPVSPHQVTGLRLVESKLTPQGPVYRVCREIPLLPGGKPPLS